MMKLLPWMHEESHGYVKDIVDDRKTMSLVVKVWVELSVKSNNTTALYVTP